MNDRFLKLYFGRIKPVFFFLLLLWVVFLFEYVSKISLVRFGVYPRKIDGLLGVFVSPLVHGGLKHIFANSVSLLTLMSLLFYGYKKIAKEVFTWIYFLSGAYVWVFARSSYHIGASGIVYGLIGFIVLAGVLSKDVRLMAISLLVIVVNAGFIWGIMPLVEGVSWESHLSGLVVGLVLAIFFKKEYKKRRREKVVENPISFTSDSVDSFSYNLIEKEKTVGDKNLQ